MPDERSGSARTAAVNATAAEIKTLVGALTSSDEGPRREAVTNVLAREPELRRHLADRLVGRLTDRRDAVRRQAEASLVELGAAVGATLFLRLLEARSAEVRERLLKILLHIPRSLPKADGDRGKLELLVGITMAATSPSCFLHRRRRPRRRPDTADDGAA